MSRLAIAVSLIASLSTAALADRVSEPSFGSLPTHFAEAPDNYAAVAVPVSRAAIRAKLAQNRVANLARFRVYQQKGVFPNNTFSDGKLNVWLDDSGNLCAAATIIKLSGNADLAMRTADQNNFIKLGDVTQGPLMDWILTSGLTQSEIAAIQEPFRPVVQEPAPQPIDARMRRAENRRLAAKYKQVDASIVKNKNASLDAATDRLLSNRELASKFLNG
ncbi:MAG TPA: hypothetical protein VK636_13855 [Gemmatimonadaceae bacterium]|nr:hypothetical protein [Gemmatimonadaceae bacterium]